MRKPYRFPIGENVGKIVPLPKAVYRLVNGLWDEPLFLIFMELQKTYKKLNSLLGYMGIKERAVTILLLCLSFLFFSATGARAQQAKLNEGYCNYIRLYADECVRQMHNHRIPASITMAQGLVESGAGKSRLATEGNNHFGIKCHKAWMGESIYANDDLPNECFRKYNHVKDSFTDHSIFLKQSRYKVLFSYPMTDYISWAKGLQSCGYATNKGYANMLIRVIEQYELYELDRNSYPSWMTGGRKRTIEKPARKEKVLTHQGYTCYGLVYVLAKKGDSFTSIAEELEIKPSRLAGYNEAPVDFPLREGDVIYLEAKHKKAMEGYETHTVKVGDSMHSIAQTYGMQVNSLYTINKLDDEYIPQEGDVLLLR